MDVVDILKKHEVESKKELLIFNPLSYDFSCQYDINEDGKPQKFTIPSKENKKFIRAVALHIANGIVDAYLADEKHYDLQKVAKARKLVLPLTNAD